MAYDPRAHQVTDNPTPVPLTLELLLSDFDNELVSLRNAAIRINGISDRLEGPVPDQGPSAVKIESPHSSMLIDMRSKLESLRELTMMLDVEASRLENLIGNPQRLKQVK